MDSMSLAADKENPAGNARPRRKKAAFSSTTRSRVDCGQRRALGENGGMPAAASSTAPVGRTMVMPNNTAPKHGAAECTVPDGSMGFRDLAFQCMPDLNEEWRNILNTKLTKASCNIGNSRAKLDQQRGLIGKLKQNIDLGKQQRQAFLDRVQAMQSNLQGQLGQLAQAKAGSKQAADLREEINTLQERLQGLETETKTASTKAQTMEDELSKVEEVCQAKEGELECLRAETAEAQDKARTAAADSEREAKRLKTTLDTEVKSCETLTKEHAELHAQIQSLEDDIGVVMRGAEAQEQAYNEKMAGLEAERREAEAGVAAAETESARLQAVHEAESKSLEEQRTELSECRTRMEEFAELAGNTEVQLTALQEDCNRMRTEVDRLKAKQDAESQELATLRAQTNSLQDDVHTANKGLLTLKEKCDTLQSEETKLTNLNAALSSSTSEIQEKKQTADATRTQCEHQITETSSGIKTLEAQLVETTAAYNEAQEKSSALQAQLTAMEKERDEIAVLNAEYAAIRPGLVAKRTKLESELAAFRAKNDSAAQQQMAKLYKHENEVKALQAKFDAVNEEVTAKRNHAQNMRDTIAAQNARIAQLEEEAIKNETLRRQLHNTMCELKGNIRVFCRVRPITSEEVQEGCDTVVCKESSGDKDTIQLNASSDRGKVDKRGKAAPIAHDFQFDKVFNQQASQEDVFEEVSSLVQSALDGYKVCIFAYGQTGSGKTYTMQGSDADGHQGIIPRSITRIVTEANRLQAQGWSYTMTASFLEIYNEQIRDLLTDKPQPTGRKEAWAETTKKIDYRISHDKNGNTTVSNMTQKTISSLAEVEELMELASKQRSVSATAMNSQSSRSHSVFTLRLTGTNTSQGTAMNGVLNLIDLAGSERLAQSKAAGSRLKETQAINKSLSALGNVFIALGSKKSHVPYRDSMLTRLLEPSLGGDSKTLMMLNLSPAPLSFHESLCSLRFGSKVNSVDVSSKSGPKREIRAIRAGDADEQPKSRRRRVQ